MAMNERMIHLDDFKGPLKRDALRIIALSCLIEYDEQKAGEYVEMLLDVDPYYSVYDIFWRCLGSGGRGGRKKTPQPTSAGESKINHKCLTKSSGHPHGFLCNEKKALNIFH